MFHLSDELPQTLTVRDGGVTVKEEPGETRVTEGDPDIPAPPPSLTVKEEVKREEVDGGLKEEQQEEDLSGDEPCTKMTMRLRRNLNNQQFVSVPQGRG